MLVLVSASVTPETLAALDVREIGDASRPAATVADRFFNGRRCDGHGGHKRGRSVKKSEQPIGFGFGFAGHFLNHMENIQGN